MPRIGLVGPSYRSQAVNAACQLTLNWYPEVIEPGNDKVPMALYPTPGTTVFAAGLVGAKGRGIIETNGRVFVVISTKLYELFANGTNIERATVADDGLPVSMAVSQIELCVVSAGTMYVMNLATAVVTTIAAATWAPEAGVKQVVFIDGFFIALLLNSQKFRISAALNGLSWPGVQVIQVSVFPDEVLAIVASHRELGVAGRTKSVVYYDSGSSQIFDVVPGSLIEQGIGAALAMNNLDNTVFWLGGDDRGDMVAYRLQGYTPTRVSTHAVEHAWQGYAVRSDAVSYSYQDQGHLFWVVYFPTANKTWVYDVATQMWHERGFLENGVVVAHRSWDHTFAFGKHLVVSHADANIYEMSINFYDDAGTAIRRVRRCPHLSDEDAWSFHHRLQLAMEVGLGPQPPLLDGNGQPRDPEVMLRWSDDGGHTWSNEHVRGVGQAGEYRKRVIWNQLGRTRDRVYEVSATDPIPWRLLDAWLKASPGNGA